MMNLFVKNFLVKVGGEQHTGWLPENSTEPLPNPVRELLFDFELEELENEGGFLLIYQSQNDELYGDTWHRTKVEAIEVANEEFNIPKDLWKELK
jgi:hypothetical protein